MRLVAFLLLAVLTAANAGQPPHFADVRAQSRSSEAWLLDRHGEPLQRLRLDPHARQLDWVELADVSPALQRAILESEDRRFFAHAGVDWLAIVAGAWQTVRGGPRRGASTVTMQLAALLDPELGGEEGGRSIARKWRQIRAALSLDAAWHKTEILETYLNLVPFRGEAIGIGAASQAYFGKHPGGLDRRESALVAALVRGPSAAPAIVAKRACTLLKRQDAAADCDGLAYFADARLRHPLPVESRPADAPHLARRLLASPGDTVTSTVDARLQRFVRETLQRQLRELARRNVMDGAALVVDNATGEVLAWVGGSGELSEASYVDAGSALRQAGSTLKPFLYAQAIEGRWITAASILDDSPLSVMTGGGLYVPQNYDRSFRGAVTVRTALASSLNVPAVRTLGMVSPESFRQRLRSLGFDSLRENGDFYGYSLALGSADVSLAMLANAYRTLANGGLYSPLRLTTGPTADPAAHRAIDARAAYIVTDILADRNARVSTFGLGSSLDTPQWSAVKTGTSKDMRDNWCIGFDDRYTVAVWVGNLSGTSMWDVSGVTGAAPIWQTVMAELQRGRRVVAPLPHAGVVSLPIEFGGHVEPPRREAFLAGTELTFVRTADEAGGAGRILYPGAGAVVALDPDIPPLNQRVKFVARLAGHETAWVLDGKRFALTNAAPGWKPVPGRHRLALVDGRGSELDAVRFEVRGAMKKSSARG